MLNILHEGSPGPLPALLIVHGLFGSARNWRAIAKQMGRDRQVLAVDMRNHAGSFWADSHGYPDMAADLAEVITAHGAPMDVLGHSMGGKAAMMLALTEGALVNRLIVADIAPVAYGHSQSHLIRAMRDLPLAGLNSRADADAALSGRVLDPAVRAFLLQSLDLGAESPCWRLNLDVLEREMTRITGWPESDFAPYAGPTLFLSGALSDYVLPEHRPAIRALFPAAHFAKIPGAGHWLHAEAPRPFIETMKVFLR
jgi:pimeloyl-ACP methyl ester carboxylesterase